MSSLRACRAAALTLLVAALGACLPLPTAPAASGSGASPPPAVAEAGPAASGASASLGGLPTGALPVVSVSPGPGATGTPVSPSAAAPSPSPTPEASRVPASVASVGGPAGSPSPAAFAPPTGAEGPWPVARVVDGDTLAVRTDGGEVTLRLIGVDTPESVHPTQPVECFGPEASAFAKATLAGQRVWLEDDASQGRLDRYGRRLAYVWLPDGTLFNEALIATGHATEYTYSRAYAYQARFRDAQAEARAAGRGLWGGCAGAASPAPAPVVTPSAATSAPLTPPPAPASATPAPSCPPGERWVNPYVRQDGTQVRGYCRKAS